MNRRGFFGILGAGFVGALALAVGPRDDAAYLQGLIDECARTGNRLVLRGGTYRLRRPIHIPRGLNFEITGNRFSCAFQDPFIEESPAIGPFHLST